MNKSFNSLKQCKSLLLNQTPKLLFSTSNQFNQKVLTIDNVYSSVLKVEYAVRGPIVVRAGQLENELKAVLKKLIYEYFTLYFYLYLKG